MLLGFLLLLPQPNAEAGVGEDIAFTYNEMIIIGTITAEDAANITIDATVDIEDFDGNFLDVTGLSIDASDFNLATPKITITGVGTISYTGGDISLGKISLNNISGIFNADGVVLSADANIAGTTFTVTVGTDNQGDVTGALSGANITIAGMNASNFSCSFGLNDFTGSAYVTICGTDLLFNVGLYNEVLAATISGDTFTIGGVTVNDFSATLDPINGFSANGTVVIGANIIPLTFTEAAGVVTASIVDADVTMSGIEVKPINATLDDNGFNGTAKVTIYGTQIDVALVSNASGKIVVSISGETFDIGDIQITNVDLMLDSSQGFAGSGKISFLGTTIDVAMSSDADDNLVADFSLDTFTVGNVNIDDVAISIDDSNNLVGTGTILIGGNTVTVDIKSNGAGVVSITVSAVITLDGIVMNLTGTLNAGGFSGTATYNDGTNNIEIALTSDAAGNINWNLANGTLVIGGITITDVALDSDGDGSGKANILGANFNLSITTDNVTGQRTAVFGATDITFGSFSLNDVSGTITSTGFSGTGDITVNAAKVDVLLQGDTAGNFTAALDVNTLTIANVTLTNLSTEITETTFSGSGTINIDGNLLPVSLTYGGGNFTAALTNASFSMGGVQVSGINGSLTNGGFSASGIIDFLGVSINIAYSSNAAGTMFINIQEAGSYNIGVITLSNFLLDYNAGVFSGSGTVSIKDYGNLPLDVGIDGGGNPTLSVTNATLGALTNVSATLSSSGFTGTATLAAVTVTFSVSGTGVISVTGIAVDEMVIGGVVVSGIVDIGGGIFEGTVELPGGTTCTVVVDKVAKTAKITAGNLKIGGVQFNNVEVDITEANGFQGSGDIQIEGSGNLSIGLQSDASGNIGGSIAAGGPLKVGGININNINAAINGDGFSGGGSVSIDGNGLDINISSDNAGNFSLGIANGTLNLGSITVENLNFSMDGSGCAGSGSVNIDELGGSLGVTFAVAGDGTVELSFTINNISVAGFTIENADVKYVANELTVVSGKVSLPAPLSGKGSVKNLVIKDSGITYDSIKMENFEVSGFPIKGSAEITQNPDLLVIGGTIDLSALGLGGSVTINDVKISASGGLVSVGEIDLTQIEVAGFTVDVQGLSITNDGLSVANGSITVPGVGGGGVSVTNLVVDKTGSVSVDGLAIENLKIGGCTISGSGTISSSPDYIEVSGRVDMGSAGSFEVTGLKIDPTGKIIDFGGAGISITIGEFTFSGEVDMTIPGQVYIKGSVIMPYVDGSTEAEITLKEADPGILGSGYTVISGFVKIPSFKIGGYKLGGAHLGFDQTRVFGGLDIDVPKLATFGLTFDIGWNGTINELCLSAETQAAGIPLGPTGLFLSGAGGCIRQIDEFWELELHGIVSAASIVKSKITLIINTAGVIKGIGDIRLVDFVFGAASLELDVKDGLGNAIITGEIWLGEDPAVGYAAAGFSLTGHIKSRIKVSNAKAMDISIEGYGMIALDGPCWPLSDPVFAADIFRYGDPDGSIIPPNIPKCLLEGDGMASGVSIGGKIVGAKVVVTQPDPFKIKISGLFCDTDVDGSVDWISGVVDVSKDDNNTNKVGSTIVFQVNIDVDDGPLVDRGVYQMITTQEFTPNKDDIVDVFGSPCPGVTLITPIIPEGGDQYSAVATSELDKHTYVLAYASTADGFIYSDVAMIPDMSELPVVVVWEYVPEVVESGIEFTLKWKIITDDAIDETRVRYAFTEAGAMGGTPTALQSGAPGVYEETLAFTPAVYTEYYVIACAKVKGVDYYSEIVMFGVEADTAAVPITVEWVDSLPATFSGANNVSWLIAGGGGENNIVSHTNVHYGDDADPRFVYDLFTPVQNGFPEEYSDVVTANAGVPTTYYFVAHATVDGVDYYSNIISSLIDNSVITVELTQTPAEMLSGEYYEFKWNIAGAGKVTLTNIQYGTTEGIYTTAVGHQSGDVGDYSVDLDITVGVATTYYFIAHAEVEGVTYQSAPVAIIVEPTQPVAITITQQPAGAVNSGSAVTVGWHIDGGTSSNHINLHYGRDPDPRHNYTGMGKKFTGIIGAAGLDFTDSVVLSSSDDCTIYVVVHAIVDGIDYYSEVMQVSVTGDGQGQGGAVSVVWVTAPTGGGPGTTKSGTWKVEGGVYIVHTNMHVGTNADPRYYYQYLSDVQKGAPGTYSDIITIPATAPGGTYYYIAHAIVDGVNYFSTVSSKGIKSPPLAGVMPDEFGLEQNSPNPFNPQTSIRYQLPKDTHTKLSIYNQLGQLVRVLIDSEQSNGIHTVLWDGKDNQDQSLPSGVYFYLLETEEYTQTMKMLMVK